MKVETRCIINFIIVYFGVFPNYFQLFLNSCKRNTGIVWTILTDNTEEYDYPENVQLIQTDFESVKKQIENKLGFHVCLDNVHKLCEFKPAFGYLFDEIVAGYDFWGYCDVDVIFGDLNRFLSDAVLSKYDKIGSLGHLSIIRNTQENNEMFMKEVEGQLLYREAFTSPNNYNFDESFQDKPNINTIFMDNGKSVFDFWQNIADIYTKSMFFRLIHDENVEKRRNAFFVWDDGRLLRYISDKKTVKCKEYMYIHLQKRQMKVNIGDRCQLYKIIPNSFDEMESGWRDDKKSFGVVKQFHINNHYFRIRWNNLLTKIGDKFKEY